VARRFCTMIIFDTGNWVFLLAVTYQFQFTKTVGI